MFTLSSYSFDILLVIKNMKRRGKKMKKITTIVTALLLMFIFTGCSATEEDSSATVDIEVSNSETTVSNVLSSDDSILDTSETFTDRDLEQEADLTDAVAVQLESGENITLTEEGVYLLSGEVENVTVIVEAADEAKVQLVLDGVSIINEDAPAIYVKSADKVFITTTNSDNYMEASDAYAADGDTNLDAVIFSKDDLVLNGTGTLVIESNQGNGITSKDDLKITGGTYDITSAEDSIEANDSICIYSGDITINSGKDALHSENEDDDSLGYIYIYGGNLNITAAGDGVQGTSVVKIDGGTINITTCTEGIEATYIQINGGVIDIYATDDGINASAKSSAYDIVIEVNGGTINVKMSSGDTDAFDSNGNIYINGGTIDVEATSAFDANGTAQLNGGDVTVNGETITSITQSQMGGHQTGGQPQMDGGGRR
jgi:uncharacterized lipoprotein YehR (DUF1307 family)